MESGAVLVVFAGDDFQAVFSPVLVGIACGSWPGLAPAGDLPFCQPTREAKNLPYIQLAERVGEGHPEQPNSLRERCCLAEVQVGVSGEER